MINHVFFNINNNIGALRTNYSLPDVLHSIQLLPVTGAGFLGE
jgi:hypothetical protein